VPDRNEDCNGKTVKVHSKYSECSEYSKCILLNIQTYTSGREGESERD